MRDLRQFVDIGAELVRVACKAQLPFESAAHFGGPGIGIFANGRDGVFDVLDLAVFGLLSPAELEQFTMNSHLESLRFAFDLPELGKSRAYFTPADSSGLLAARSFGACACAIGHPGLANDAWLECDKYRER